MNIARMRTFIQHDLWHIQLAREPRGRRLRLTTLRLAILTVREFIKDKCAIRASALTYYTLLSIVPVLALAFGVAKGFKLDDKLEAAIRKAAEGQGEAVDKAIGFASNMLDKTSGGVVAGIGVALLLWTVIKLLGQIETAMNEIWLVNTPRSWPRRFSDYLSVMIVAPVLFVIASSATGLIASKLGGAVQEGGLAMLHGPVRLLVMAFPTLLMGFLFAFLYVFMPNTRIRTSSALLGGLLASVVYSLTQWLFIRFQVGVSKAGAIYGSFAALPLFLTWVQVSWMIVLFGAEFAFSHQFVELSEFEQDARRASPRFRKLTALCLARESVRAFVAGKPAPSAEELADAIGVPYHVVREVLTLLVDAGVLSEVRRLRDKQSGFQPASDVENLRVSDVLARIETNGSETIPCEDTEARRTLAAAMESFHAAATATPHDVRLREL